MIKKAGAALLILGALAGPAVVPASAQEKIVTVKVAALAETLKPGETVPMMLEIAVAPPFHINTEVPSEDYLIGTAVAFAPKAGLTFGNVVFPQSETIKLSFSETPLAVYAGTVKVPFEVTLDKNFEGSEAVVEGTVSYQACNDQSCLAPEDAAFSGTFPAAGAKAPQAAAAGVTPSAVKQIPLPTPADELDPVKPDAAVSSGPGERAETGKKPAPEPSRSSVPFEGKGLPLIFALVFLGGLGLNLTPCVYPLIPITVSYFGGQAQGKKGDHHWSGGGVAKPHGRNGDDQGKLRHKHPSAPPPQEGWDEAVHQRRPEELQSVRDPDQGVQTDGLDVNPLRYHPGRERGAGQGQGHAGGKAQDEHEGHPAVGVDGDKFHQAVFHFHTEDRRRCGEVLPFLWRLAAAVRARKKACCSTRSAIRSGCH